MEENFVPFEIAKKLKEKGFNEPCYKYYQKGLLDSDNCWNRYNKGTADRCSTPTISQVLKWLREEKEIDIILQPIFLYNENNREREYGIEIYAPQLNKPTRLDYFKNWENGALAGIEYVLDNLI